MPEFKTFLQLLQILSTVLLLTNLDFRLKNVIISLMKRALCFILILFGFCGLEAYSAPALENIQIDIRDADPVILNAGTFIPVISAQEISTQYCSEGYKVRFIATTDLFMYETKIVPENTLFEGYIEKMNEPVIGTNASMIIRVSKMILPDGYELPMKGYIYTSNNNLIGGGISEPENWIRMPHYQHRLKGTATLQLKPGEKKKMGEHTTLPAGLDLLIILTDPLEITHVLTN